MTVHEKRFNVERVEIMVDDIWEDHDVVGDSGDCTDNDCLSYLFPYHSLVMENIKIIQIVFFNIRFLPLYIIRLFHRQWPQLTM